MKTTVLAQTLREHQAEQAQEHELQELERAERDMVDVAQAIQMDVLAGPEAEPSSVAEPPPPQAEPLSPRQEWNDEGRESPSWTKHRSSTNVFGLYYSEDSIPDPPPWAPFPNISTCNVLSWQDNDSNSKSNAQINLLTRDVFQQPGFNLADLAQFDAAHKAQRLDDYVDKVDGSPLSAMDGWMKSFVYVRLPKEGPRSRGKIQECTLPDLIQDVNTEIYGIPAMAAVLTFLKRELMQAIILLILNTDGFIDGIRHRDFLRFFIWSADYVEKVLLACIKYLARRHCPRCRINKDHTIGLGTRADIFQWNKMREDNDDVFVHISLSRVICYETQSAMSLRLRDHGFNHYSLFVPDFLHEFELGVWKSIFTRLMRLLYAAGGDKIQLFNKRSRRSDDRPSADSPPMSQIKANLQLATMRTTFRWLQYLTTPVSCQYGKPCYHPLTTASHQISHLTAPSSLPGPETLDSFDDAADNIGSDVRMFVKKTCKKYHTVKLPRKAAARGHREARLTAQGKNSTSAKSSGIPASRKVKMFNPRTYKLHALRDYAYNTTMQTGECEHCRVKRWYERTNKHKHVGQIACHTRRANKLNIVQMHVNGWHAKLYAKKYGDKRTQMRAPHANIRIPDFSINLQTHLLACLADHGIGPLDGPNQDGTEFSFSDRSRLIIHHSQMYPHQILCLNYTTYDLRRCQDIINPRTHSDIMLISGIPLDGDDSSSAHGFEYARIIKIFHVNVCLADSQQMSAFERMDVLFVRWFRVDHSITGSFKAKRLYRLEFTPADNDDGIASGFVDPSDIVRVSHMRSLMHIQSNFWACLLHTMSPVNHRSFRQMTPNTLTSAITM
ncbi:hypothetical protein C8Q80DRAFT_1124151 [Daedaleopsis nitida]|nr:hypothetical protein C8Q80DRAFT_1124151 [Daedaleopsis nitida]